MLGTFEGEKHRSNGLTGTMGVNQAFLEQTQYMIIFYLYYLTSFNIQFKACHLISIFQCYF